MEADSHSNLDDKQMINGGMETVMPGGGTASVMPGGMASVMPGGMSSVLPGGGDRRRPASSGGVTDLKAIGQVK